MARVKKEIRCEIYYKLHT